MLISLSVTIPIQYRFAKMQRIYGFPNNQSDYWCNTTLLSMRFPWAPYSKLYVSQLLVVVLKNAWNGPYPH